MEHIKRTLLKTISWRMIALLTTIIVVYIYTGKVKESLAVGFSANLLKMFLYYIHERLWNKVRYGRLKPPEYQI